MEIKGRKINFDLKLQNLRPAIYQCFTVWEYNGTGDLRVYSGAVCHTSVCLLGSTSSDLFF